MFVSSILGAFQHAGVYRGGVTGKLKNEFRKFVKKILEGLGNKYKKGNVSDLEHIRNIQILADEVRLKYGNILRKGKLRFGVAQKLINLYLKYLWCMDDIPTPPHCPFDSIIYKELGVTKISPFTKMDSIKEYNKLVKVARKKARNKNESIAEWELRVWSQ